MPLILTHGWPGSFAEMINIIPLLTDPEAHGLSAEDSFDVIVPSLPGFGFSDRLQQNGTGFFGVAETWVNLMSALGYERFTPNVQFESETSSGQRVRFRRKRRSSHAVRENGIANGSIKLMTWPLFRRIRYMNSYPTCFCFSSQVGDLLAVEESCHGLSEAKPVRVASTGPICSHTLRY